MSFSGTLGIVGPLPPPAGGMATQTRQLSDLMSAEGIDVTLVQNNKPYSPSVVAKLKGIRALFRLLPYLWDVWRLAGKVDVIHLMANSGWSWQLFSAPVIWAGWFRKTPVIVNYRGGEAQAYFSLSFSRVKPTLKRAAKIVVPSAYLQQVFSGFGVEVQVIPNIINLERFKPVDRLAEKPALKLISTRNLEAIYGIETAIEAFAMARKDIPDIELHIAGSGPQQRQLEQLVKKQGLEGKVFFVGRLDAREIVEFYHSADAMLNPTTVDNMPNSVLESLACGVPVITTDVGGIPFIVEHEATALMVPAGDSAGMARQMVRLFEDPGLRQKLVTNGLSAVQPYAWPRVKQQWLNMYESQRVSA